MTSTTSMVPLCRAVYKGGQLLHCCIALRTLNLGGLVSIQGRCIVLNEVYRTSSRWGINEIHERGGDNREGSAAPIIAPHSCGHPSIKAHGPPTLIGPFRRHACMHAPNIPFLPKGGGGSYLGRSSHATTNRPTSRQCARCATHGQRRGAHY